MFRSSFLCVFLLLVNMKSGLKKSLKSIMPLRLGWKSDTCFCMLMKVCTAGQTTRNAPIYLNVYDLTPLNGYVYWAGFGVFHSGVEVHGVEYAFGAHDNPTSGVFEVEPRQCPGFRFRKSIFMGTTCLDPIQAREFMENLSVNYNGDTYHLLVKNCNHFTKDLCRKLTGNSIPKWVNRLAKIGRFCDCLLPEAFRVSASRNDPDSADGEKRRLRSSFSCPPSISARQKVLSSSFLFLPSPLKSCLPPLELRKSGPIPLKER
ncbi:hypothetical protein IEQ34_021256 [Dendrobium chrysotoxum]|uniref:PPPDE domain-containing protein n=1 Tax=Dendrobium chrysotoxum TaxID=161865 RepID=A0AAV7G3N5_DENCH|nr:hypothetical protein IEQ34_021256 [Dendrobium chrysotoxum]